MHLKQILKRLKYVKAGFSALVVSDMKLLVLGYGNIGSIIASDLASSMPSAHIVIGGRRLSKIEEVVKDIKRENVSGIQVDARKHDNLVKTLKGFDVAAGALPGELGFRSIKAAIEAQVDFVDVSYMPENPLTLHEEAVNADITVVPDCGVAPGVSNLLVGFAAGKLEKVEDVQIMVGGLPEKPIPPFGYTITWSAEGLIDEYVRRAKMIEDGKLIEREALTGLEKIEFPGVGMLEAFYTDGLRTLLYTLEGVQSMWEKTLRYGGHVSKIRFLKALGFLDETPIDLGKVQLSPRKLTVKLFEDRLTRPEIPDLLVMKVEVGGIKQDNRIRFVYSLLDRYDEKQGVTAMARTTGYPTSIVAQMIAHNMIEEKGVVPLEKLGDKEEIFNHIMEELKRRRIEIKGSLPT